MAKPGTVVKRMFFKALVASQELLARPVEFEHQPRDGASHMVLLPYGSAVGSTVTCPRCHEAATVAATD